MAKFSRFNYDKASEQEVASALSANQQLGLQRAMAFANRRAEGVQGLGAAAARSGKFIDTSAAPGYQSPVTGAMTALYKRGITGPVKGQQTALQKLIALRMGRPYQAGLKANDEEKKYTGMGVINAAAGAAAPYTGQIL